MSQIEKSLLKELLEKGSSIPEFLAKGFRTATQIGCSTIAGLLNNGIVVLSQMAGFITSRDRAVQVTLWKLWICSLSIMTIRTLQSRMVNRVHQPL
ncbi:hypothetical protein M427DRAFT_141351 [Gonapodya prolifera JEL478]|uniref:Uncharacterized protein n=1 Tax=Gonapodya prolifera (strain JEL478) TaxID=1344416 RepID=A0A138ZXZ5_GONPJ|nr:hypothetical protein M427DRAFT_141351 [Gonapodya prolifera JEL478]|eukprot:KXS09145.1 hypothetical protein M427DRAFT_141351 [Gonapodya prolifera JEL478]